MNQILFIANSKKNLNKKNLFKFIFFISIISMVIISFIYLYYRIYLNNQEKLSLQYAKNYNIYKLYNTQKITNYYDTPSMIGIIEIPIIQMYYPIFNKTTDDLLKISPCVFYGKMPPVKSNLCIAGHNYDNNKFFSNINSLKNNDIINIYDINGNKYSYLVYKNYEVLENDFSPILSNSLEKELTLITCNNFTKNRIIIKAK